MNIIVFSHMYPNSENSYSGIFVHEQVKALINEGINVKVIAPIPYLPKMLSFLNKKWRKFAKTPQMEIIDQVTVYRPRYIAIPGGKLKHYWGFFYAYFATKTVKLILRENNIDLFHVHGTLPDDHAVSILSKKFKIPFVVTVHGASVFSVSRIKKHFQRSLNSKKLSDAIICVSNVLHKKMKDFLGPQYNDKIYTVYNGYKTENINIEKKEDGEFTILFVGTIYEQKGIRYLIETFALLKKKYDNIKLTIVGGGELSQDMMELAKRLEIYDKVEFKGVLSHRKTLMEYAKSDVFILPSWNEGFGIVYLEAMSQAVPIIGTKGYGISDIIVDGENGFLVSPRNHEEIYAKLEILITDRVLREKIGKKGQETVKELTWERNAIENIKIYQHVISRFRPYLSN